MTGLCSFPHARNFLQILLGQWSEDLSKHWKYIYKCQILLACYYFPSSGLTALNWHRGRIWLLMGIVMMRRVIWERSFVTFHIVNAFSILMCLIQKEGWVSFWDLSQLGLSTSNEWVGSFCSACVTGERMEKENVTPDKWLLQYQGVKWYPARKWVLAFLKAEYEVSNGLLPNLRFDYKIFEP